MMKFGLNLNPVKPELYVEFAQRAEALGFESVWVGEHVAVPTSDDWWRGPEQDKHLNVENPEERKPFSPKSDFMDPLVVLSHLAAVTSTIRLGTGIYMLPLRHPILVARMLSAVDILSGGRLDFGVGLGWLPDEYDFTNSDWKTRGRQMDESIRCLRALFEEDEPSFEGEYFSFPSIGFEPKPLQKPLPIYIGGDSKAAIRRAATLADGWYGSPHQNSDVKEQLVLAGRDPGAFRFSSIHIGPVTEELVAEVEALGTSRMVVTPWKKCKPGQVGREGLEQLEEIAARLM